MAYLQLPKLFDNPILSEMLAEEFNDMQPKLTFHWNVHGCGRKETGSALSVLLGGVEVSSR